MPAYPVMCRCGREVARGGAGFHRCVDGHVRLGWAYDAPGWQTHVAFTPESVLAVGVDLGAGEKP